MAIPHPTFVVAAETDGLILKQGDLVNNVSFSPPIIIFRAEYQWMFMLATKATLTSCKFVFI
jgi:hypothetical protein